MFKPEMSCVDAATKSGLRNMQYIQLIGCSSVLGHEE